MDKGESIMAEYIDREALIASFKRWNIWTEQTKDLLMSAPSISVPQKHGKWELDHSNIFRNIPTARCSLCKCVSGGGTSNYCPNCGAKMDV